MIGRNCHFRIAMYTRTQTVHGPSTVQDTVMDGKIAQCSFGWDTSVLWSDRVTYAASEEVET
jgi:hypothetical protein